MLEAPSYSDVPSLPAAHPNPTLAAWLSALLSRRLFGNIGCVWFAHSYDGHSRTFSGVASGGGPDAAGRLLAPGHVGAFFHDGELWRLQLAAMVARLGAYNVLVGVG